MNCCLDKSIRNCGFKLSLFCEVYKWFNKTDIQITLVQHVLTQIPILCTYHYYANNFAIPSKFNGTISIHGKDQSCLSGKSFSFSILSSLSLFFLLSVSFLWQTFGLLRTVMGPVMPVPEIPPRSKTIQFCKLLLPSQTTPLASSSTCTYGRNIQAQSTTREWGLYTDGHKSFWGSLVLSWCL